MLKTLFFRSKETTGKLITIIELTGAIIIKTKKNRRVPIQLSNLKMKISFKIMELLQCVGGEENAIRGFHIQSFIWLVDRGRVTEVKRWH